VAKARTVKTILQQCYGDKSAVTDELVQYVSTTKAKLPTPLTVAMSPLLDARASSPTPHINAPGAHLHHGSLRKICRC
jgi:hypothetical protein